MTRVYVLWMMASQLHLTIISVTISSTLSMLVQLCPLQEIHKYYELMLVYLSVIWLCIIYISWATYAFLKCRKLCFFHGSDAFLMVISPSVFFAPLESNCFSMQPLLQNLEKCLNFQFLGDVLQWHFNLKIFDNITQRLVTFYCLEFVMFAVQFLAISTHNKHDCKLINQMGFTHVAPVM